MKFDYVDLFAGIGGFHAALGAAGGDCVMVSEIDPAAQRVYERNWASDVKRAKSRPVVEGDICPLTDPEVNVPAHDVLAAGFPCQPFSKSGFQRGMNEARGTLFWNICRILEERRPSIVFLENVRNIAGPRHAHEWETIIRSLRELGYRVSSEPTVFSPHWLPPSKGGTPQVRERVFILGTYVGEERALREVDDGPVVPKGPAPDWSPGNWDLEEMLLQDDEEIDDVDRYRLSASEQRWLEVWDEFVKDLLEFREGLRLPGFPLWADFFRAVEPSEFDRLPRWKSDFIAKNSAFYFEHQSVIDRWRARNSDLEEFPASRRKLEWQAQDATSLFETVMHFRPSGIRAKQPTYLPALVAITQTSIIGWRNRRITPREAARLQGLPEWFDFGDQSDSATYKQLGNGVAVGAAYHVFHEHVLQHADDLPDRLVKAVIQAGDSPTLQRRRLSVA